VRDEIRSQKSESRMQNRQTPERRSCTGLLLAGGTVIDPVARKVLKADVLIENGRIAAVGQKLKAAAAERIDCTGKHIAPGFTDMHCHLREPGREDEETVATGALSALSGGFTRICPMPNTEPAVDTEAQVQRQIRLAEAAGLARVHPIGCCTKARQGRELAEIGAMHSAGAVAFSDDGSPVADAMVMRRCLEYAKTFDVPVISHCEVKELVEGIAHEGLISTRLGLKAAPDVAESAQAARDILLAESTGGRLHIAHVSARATVDLLRWAKARGIEVTAETCPHYFTLTEAAITEFDTNCKVNPPLRTEADRKAIVAGLADGTIDAIATDHAPHLRGEKETEWDAAPPGMIGFETAFSLGYEQLVLSKALSLADYIGRLTVAPARILGLPQPSIAKGSETDLVLLDLRANWIYSSDTVRSRSSNSPFLGRSLRGRVFSVVLGETLFTF
jgi:dihydroorotase